MVIRVKKTKLISLSAVCVLLFVAVIFLCSAQNAPEEKRFIKWAELNVTARAIADAVELDIATYDKLYHISFIDTLSYLAMKNGNNWSSYNKSQLDKMTESLGDIYTVSDLAGENQYFRFYKEVFSAALGGLVGEYTKQVPDGQGGIKTESGYGLVAYSPVAEGFSYSHYDDFGNSRSYGYKRRHLGNDLMGNVGTPIVAVEGGTVECIGWNRYGGWRLGIRSFDGKRSYYYAHLRKDRPYHCDIELGTRVKAGQVIGYMGMTGYSEKSNVNGMSVPHLHFGMQLIFDESQKEGSNQIWLDVYQLVKYLSRNKATVIRDGRTGEYYRKYDIICESYPESIRKLTDLGDTLDF